MDAYAPGAPGHATATQVPAQLLPGLDWLLPILTEQANHVVCAANTAKVDTIRHEATASTQPPWCQAAPPQPQSTDQAAGSGQAHGGGAAAAADPPVATTTTTTTTTTTITTATTITTTTTLVVVVGDGW